MNYNSLKNHRSALTTYPKNQEEIYKKLYSRIDKMDVSSIMYICTGHFMLIYDDVDGLVKPGILDEKNSDKFNSKVKKVLGLFPNYTWKIGCDLVQYAKNKGKKVKLILLINDWQYVPKDNNRADPSHPNRFRHEFYENFKELPFSYRQIMKKRNLTLEDIYCPEANEFFFREVRLRDRFTRHMKTIFKNGKQVELSSCEVSVEDGKVYYENMDSQKFQIVNNGRTGCAGEITQMISEICEYNSENDICEANLTIVNLLPISCTVPVNQGSEMAFSLMAKEPKIINIFFNGHGAQEEQDFYDYTKGSRVTYHEFE